MRPEFSRQIFEKYSNVKFHADPFSGSRVVPCGGADGPTNRGTDGQKDMTMLIIAFGNFVNAPKD